MLTSGTRNCLTKCKKRIYNPLFSILSWSKLHLCFCLVCSLSKKALNQLKKNISNFDQRNTKICLKYPSLVLFLSAHS